MIEPFVEQSWHHHRVQQSCGLVSQELAANSERLSGLEEELEDERMAKADIAQVPTCLYMRRGLRTYSLSCHQLLRHLLGRSGSSWCGL